MSCYATQLHFMRRIANDNASVNTTTRSAFKRAIVGSDEQLEGRSADGSGSGYGWPGWELVRVSIYGTDTLEAHLGVALGHLWRWHI
jgi:hypothetical protein